jgi:hypothetical protein
MFRIKVVFFSGSKNNCNQHKQTAVGDLREAAFFIATIPEPHTQHSSRSVLQFRQTSHHEIWASVLTQDPNFPLIAPSYL